MKIGSKFSIESAVQCLVDKGMSFADIDQVIDGQGVQITQAGQIRHYQELHYETDELARMWELYPRNNQ